MSDARYRQARDRAFASWARSQPQLVIPGTDGLEEAGRRKPAGLLEPVPPYSPLPRAGSFHAASARLQAHD